MITKIRKLINKRKKLWAVVLIILTVFLAYGLTLRMYFWQDDSALIFKLQNPEGLAGSFGYGIIGGGAYKYLVTPFVPFFPLFGLEPFGYFAVGFLTYLLATVAFYFFAKELFENKKAAFFSTLIFAAGYVGSDIMFRIINSWQTNIGLILSLLSLGFLTKFLKSKSKGKIKYYLLGLLFFLASVEFVFIRSHSLIFVILAIDLLLNGFSFDPRKLLRFVLKQAPFWLIFYIYYLRGGTMGSSALGVIINDLLSGKFEVLITFFATVGNGLFYNAFQDKIIGFFPVRHDFFILLIFSFVSWFSLSFFGARRKLKILSFSGLLVAYFLNQHFGLQNFYWYRTHEAILSGAVGFYVFIVALSLIAAFWMENRIVSISLAFGYLAFASQVFGYFIQYPTSIFGTTHRYLSHGFFGYSIFFGALTYAVYKKQKRLLGFAPLILLVSVNLFLGIKYQARLVRDRSKPSRRFYEDLTKYVPEIKKGSAFYFDIKSNSFYQQQFNNFFSVGSMPESTALAIYYGVDRDDIFCITSIDELLFKLSAEEINLENLYTFYYGEGGLIDTTDKVRMSLEGKNREKVLPSMPILVSGIMQVDVDINQISYPYSSLGGKERKFGLEEKEAMIIYLMERKNYYKKVRPQSLSEWKFQEIENITDNDVDSSWRGHRIYWHNNRHEQVVLDLGRTIQVGRLVWTNWHYTLTPLIYSIDVSADGYNWVTVKKVVGGPERVNGEVVVENFDNVLARFVRMDIQKTQSDDAPAISEIEVIGPQFTDVNVLEASGFISEPFYFVENRQEMMTILSKVAPLINARVTWSTDKQNGVADVPIEQFNVPRYFEVVLMPGGTVFEDINFDLAGAPLKVIVKDLTIRNLSFEEIMSRNLIKKISEN